MIKNIIFDLGNVLLNFKPREFLLRYTEDLELINDFITKVFGSETWLKLDRGLISMENAKNIFINKYPETKDLLIQWFDHWLEILTPIKTNVEILRELKQIGYKIYVLSNVLKEAFNHVKARHDFFNLLDGRVLSCEEKVLKPEEAIFEILLQRYNLTPKECVFLDDYATNLEPAKKLGMHVVIIRPETNLKAELRRLNVNI